MKRSQGVGTLRLLAVVSAVLALAIAADAEVRRYHHFERAADALELWGDREGAATIRQLGYGAAVVPPELSELARTSFSGYVANYDQYRSRVREAILRPVHAPSDQWRVDRAEAALHLVSHEMEQGMSRGGGSLPLIRQFLYDAWWSLNHHIATELIAVLPAPTADIGVIPERVMRGESAVVSWNTTNASTATINGDRVALAGNMSVSPSSTTTYELIAAGQGGSARDRATLVVTPQPPKSVPTATIKVVPDEIERGRQATLSWTTTNASVAKIDGEDVALTGQRSVSPAATKVYELVATGVGGRATAQAVLTVRVPEPPVADIGVSPETIERGQTAQLSWRTQRATRAEINGEMVDLTGARVVMPTATQVYELVATGDGGRAVDRAVLVVNAPPAPTADLSVYPGRITEGECATLTWKTRAATRATINGEVVGLDGEMRVCPVETLTYELLASGPGGRATDRESVTVIPRSLSHYRIHFDFDKAFVRNDARETMAMIANLMRENPGMQMRIEGHCDWMGSDAYNMALGMRRAEAARDYFVNIYGISPTRFSLVSFGESRPMADNAYPDGRDNPRGRQMNRRAVFAPVR